MTEQEQTIQAMEMAQGYLKVFVWEGSPANPLADVLVDIYDSESGELLAELRSDSSGTTETITLPAPPLAFSQNPELPRPFKQYNLRAMRAGEGIAQVEHVQIYPESTALQQVDLLPEASRIVIPYPVLWGDFPPKIPEDAIKPLPPPTGLVVLDRPVIPEFVVVHAGRPDRSAPQYTVGYRDYIKNVASSEIYATWEREALKANILAIGSFTLNRVFTEWYRGKGYSFTITNSTAFDQAFTYGRTIYREISEIVDEVFTSYITKPDIRQPLFTQYSDGREVVRAGWLSQWGSQDLAKRGYTALQILKTYYGSDIILKQAEKVQGIPLSFPGYVLRIGARGEAVRTIQSQLNVIAKNYPAVPRLSADGVYGTATSEAVKTFQRIFSLPETGEVNFPTWYEISNLYVGVARLAERS